MCYGKRFWLRDWGGPGIATEFTESVGHDTQVFNRDVAELVDVTPSSLALGIARVLDDSAFATKLASEAAALAESDYSDPAYLKKVARFYDRVVQSAEQRASSAATWSRV